MFSWISLYEEAATALRQFRNRQQELVRILADMAASGLRATPVQDEAADGSRSQLTEMDPFTFLGNFNRGITNENRSAMWNFLKQRWNLHSALPADYDGIPVLNNMKSWLMPYASQRQPDHVSILWDVFEHILDARPESLDAVLFDHCLTLREVAKANLTMGMFWCRPGKWISLDRRNLAYAAARGLTTEPRDGEGYKRWMADVRTTTGLTPQEFSREAWLQRPAPAPKTQPFAPPFDKFFTGLNEAHAVLDAFREAVLILQEGSEVRDVRVVTRVRDREGRDELRIIFGQWAVMTYRPVDGGAWFELLLPADSPLTAEARNPYYFKTIFGERRMGTFELPAAKVLERGPLWETHLESLRWLRSQAGLWKSSTFGWGHSDSIYRLIVNKEDRQTILEEGLSEEGKDSGPAHWVDKEQPDPPIPPPPVPPDRYGKEQALSDLFMSEADLDKVMALWRRKKNIILQGAPGTGKTFIARRLAFLLMGVKNESRVQMVQFHQSSSYEDFIQGIRPEGTGFSVGAGVFHTFCRRAMQDPELPHVFIIDEINRGNLSKVFGELMMLIEPDKRRPEFAMRLTYARDDEERFYVPENVYLIGTMNTADRSLSLVDYALRRRFGFWEMEPGFDTDTFAKVLAESGAETALVKTIRSRMNRLNAMIEEATDLGRGYRIGHSFFVPGIGTTADGTWLEDIIAHEILPLVEEYWVDDEKKRGEARRVLTDTF